MGWQHGILDYDDDECLYQLIFGFGFFPSSKENTWLR
jgi:hypothetical protein